MEDFNSFIRRLKDSADIVDVIGRVTVLKKAGQSYKGLCPFHKEKTPSFNVVPQKGIFHCFGCGVGGTVIDFVMRQERLEFMEAVEKLARETGLEIPSREKADPKKAAAARKLEHRIFDVNQTALDWFRKNLLERRNALASDYLPKRGLSEETAERFQLGAALDSWDSLTKFLRQMDYSDDLLVSAGLAVRSESGHVYDRFRNRLIFPIWDSNGRPAGFGGRQLDSEEKGAKYLNSSETTVYKKSKILYGLNIAAESIKESGYAIVCEGYMDVIMAHTKGFGQAVASLGTALTSEQARLLKRHTGKVFFLYDGDSAGQKAMLRGGEPLLSADIDTRVITLPEGEDPDSYLRGEGPEALEKRRQTAVEFLEFAITAVGRELDLNEMRGQAELVNRIGPMVNGMQNAAMKEAAVGMMAKKLPLLPRDAIHRLLSDRARKDRERERRRGAGRDEKEERQDPAEAEAKLPIDPAGYERRLLKIMVENRAALELVRSKLNHEWVTDPKVGDWIFYLADHDGYAETLLDALNGDGECPGDRSIITEIMAWSVPKDGCTPEMAEELLILMQERLQSSLIRQLFEMIDERSLDEDAALRLIKAFHAENRNRLNLSGGKYRSGNAATRRWRNNQ